MDKKIEMSNTIDLQTLGRVIREAKKIAERYRRLTGKPLGITGEIGEFAAADLLNLMLTQARQPGYDAISQDGHKIQIKTRCVLTNSKKSQRIGTIKLNYKWHKVVLVLVDEHYEPLEIYQASRKVIELQLTKLGSKARNQRGQLSISSFKRIAGAPIWSKANIS